MSVSGISNNLATDQLNALALSSLSRNLQNTTSNLDLPTDEVTLQSGNSTSAASGDLSDVHKAYDGLRQIGNETGGVNAPTLPDGTHQYYGGPVRRLEGAPFPADPVKHIAKGNPIQQHLPMPLDFKPSLGISAPTIGQDTMPPVYGGGLSVSA